MSVRITSAKHALRQKTTSIFGCSWPKAGLRAAEVNSCLAQDAEHFVSVAGRRDHAQCDRNDLNTANVVYKVKLAVAAAPQIEKAAAPLRVELEAFEIAEIALPSGNILKFKLIPEGGGELRLCALASSEQ